MVDEYKTRGKNNVFIDKRIGKTNTRLSEEDKMRMRYMREQKERLKDRALLGTRKKQKFNLEDDLDSDE